MKLHHTDMAKLWRAVLILGVLSTTVRAFEIVQENDNVTVACNILCTLAMDENNHYPELAPTALFRIKDAQGLPTVSSWNKGSSSFKYEIKADGADYLFLASNTFDYDTGASNYQFTVAVTGSADVNDIFFIINNIDDEPPLIQTDYCEMEENVIYTKDTSTCKFTLSDPDGWLSKIDIEIKDTSLFKLEFPTKPDDTKTSSEIILTNTQELDYETITIYMLTVSLKDELYDRSSSIIVNVKDAPDTPPVWTTYKNSLQINENEECNFTVVAKDGDYGINSNISYSSKDDNNVVTVDEFTGLVQVPGIDIDDGTFSSNYEITLTAAEVSEPHLKTDLVVTLFIQDVNDNNPVILSTTSETNPSLNINFDGTTPKEIELSIEENYKTNLEFKIQIKDIDSGTNAQFQVVIDDVGDVKASDAFQIVPSMGYQAGDFAISVKDSSKLDYEDPAWRNIQFKVLSIDTNKGVNGEDMQDELSVTVHLENLFDEYPQFNNTIFDVHVDETIKKDAKVTQIIATDKDEDDVITYSILPDMYNSQLAINNEGEITVIIDNAFDYDRSPVITLQVKAEDLGNNSNTATLNIHLNDINNKPPTIEVESAIELEENQKVDTVIPAKIHASDSDSSAELVAFIDWDASTARKDYQTIKAEDLLDKTAKFVDLKVDGSGGSLDINFIVNHNYDTETAPDYEMFDTLYLMIVVNDTKTEEGTSEATVKFIITIINVNDNKPEFITQPNASLSVTEKAASKTIIGTIRAKDADGDTRHYSITSIDTNYDWVEIDEETGELSVKEGANIDADTDKVYNTSYTCIANDGKFNSDELEITIQIIDKNNQIPTITLDNVLHVKESMEASDVITTIITTDDDRDEPYHTVSCSFQEADSDCEREAVRINKNKEIVVGNEKLDYDEGTRSFTCNIKCYDNPLKEGDETQNQKQYTFRIEIEDVNDNIPEITTTTLKGIDESMKKNTDIDKIEAKDIDSGNYAKLTFKIAEVTVTGNENINEDLKKLFTLNQANADDKDVTLQATKDLKNYFGTFSITVEVSDCTGCNIDEETINTSNKTLDLTVDKFNFEQPRFIFPSEDDKAFPLDMYQVPNSQLNVFNSTVKLQNFEASDNADDVCSGKWDISFTVEQNKPALDKNTKTMFIINNDIRDICTGQLRVNNDFETTDKSSAFELTITASVKDGTPHGDEKPYDVTQNIEVQFINKDVDPYFDTNTLEIILEEDNPDAYYKLENPAHYPIPLGLVIYYKLFAPTPEVQSLFKIDTENVEILLLDALDYESVEEYNFVILASKDAEGTTKNNKSYLDVTVHVKDVNDNSPSFVNDKYTGAILVGSGRTTPIMTIEAHDVDTVGSELSFSILKETFTATGKGIDNIPEPFTLTDESAEGNVTVKLNFEVESSMSGYFTFYVNVSDTEVEGHGPNTNQTLVTIFIVTSDNVVNFRFENVLEDVVAKQYTMMTIIGDILGYSCNKQLIDKDSKDGTYLNNVTKASLYFLSDDDKLISADEILRKVSVLEVYSKLKTQLLKESLLLMSFTSDSTNSENSEDVLRAWLIGVSVVLGAFLLILVVIYFLKTRSLTKRLSNLTNKKFGSQESGLNRIGINVPNANQHAAEGSNPVFNNETLKVDFDQRSIASGDSSDLIGVEDNPEFDYENTNFEESSEYI